MPKSRFPDLLHERSRHGKWAWCHRRDKGKRTRLPGDYMSPEFVAAYHEAAKAVSTEAPASGTLGWLIDAYMDSPAFKAHADESRRQMAFQFKRVKASAGSEPYAAITALEVAEGRDARAATPSAANKFIKAMRKLFAFALERKLVKTNPAAGMALLALPNRATGFKAWEEEDVARYEARWPVGSRERLALDLILYAGVRRGDAVRFGRQMEKKPGFLTFKTQKSVNMGKPVEVNIPILPPLAASIAATKTGDMTYLATLRGLPMKKTSFGTWFKAACTAAGVTKTAHGLRKIAATRCAENGATEAQLNAIFGWTDGSRESATYTRTVNRAKLAMGAASMLLPAPSNVSPHPVKKAN